MKAFITKKFGPPSALKISETEVPVPQDKEVLVRILTTAINDWDWSMVRGRPKLYRLLYGLFKPKHPIPGMELSGIVEKTGSDVTNFKEGDEVFGDTSDHGFGSFAEYICIHQDALMKKPDEISHAEATAIPHAAMLAYQSMFDITQIKKGMRILINGAGGGVGVFALQLAKQFDCEVTGVDTGEKLNMMKELGFDHVIDYKTTDFALQNVKYDFILDTKTSRSPFRHAKVLNKDGIYIMVGGTIPKILSHLFFGKMAARKNRNIIKILPLKPMKGMVNFMKMYREKKCKCVIDGPYEFEKIPELLSYYGEGRHSGKVVVKVGDV